VGDDGGVVGSSLSSGSGANDSTVRAVNPC